MSPKDIKEKECYYNEENKNYFRCVEMIVDSPSRPGGKVVAWSTDTFNVKLSNGYSRGKENGKCGINTFAKWATSKI